jgi:hypothetical protein
MLNKEQLDLLTEGGCQNPSCNHESHRELFFHARCHDSAGLRMSHTETDHLSLRCAECKEDILHVATDRPTALQPMCHPNSPVWVSYERGSGKLEVICRKCRKPVTTIPVHEQAVAENGSYE